MTLPPLEVEEFGEAFRAIHGFAPYRWQERLLRQVAGSAAWPRVIAAPTGAGKTAVLDVALFHLALEAGAGPGQRRAPLRIVLAVDRRIIVDQAYARAYRIRDALDHAAGDAPIARMAERLRAFAEDTPLHVAELRGGMPLERTWARRPDQPTILCTTVDQLGSRLLFRGYGVSDSMAPVHAGLLGNDSLLILDEAHLSVAFEDTLDRIGALRGAELGAGLPFQVTALTATPRPGVDGAFVLTDEERCEEPIRRRLEAAKPVRLLSFGKPPKRGSGPTVESDANGSDEAPSAEVTPHAEAERVGMLVGEARALMQRLRGEGAEAPVVAVVVNRVPRARAVFQRLCKPSDPAQPEDGQDDALSPAEAILLTGRVRPADRDRLVAQWQDRLEGRSSPGDPPLFVVATQCIEAGADFDFDAMVTDLAPIDALRQRFGRLARAGNRRGQPAPGVIVAGPERADRKNPDPIYGQALPHAWSWLEEAARSGQTGAHSPRRKGRTGTSGEPPAVDFGPAAMDHLLAACPAPSEAFAPSAGAPVLREADIEAFAMTSPRPVPDPLVSPFLHGELREDADVALVWRADIEDLLANAQVSDTQSPEDLLATARVRLALLPPRPAEALRLPVWQVRAWLSGRRRTERLADVPLPETSEEKPSQSSGSARRVFRWGGPEVMALVGPGDIRPGATLVLPASCGGCDAFGWAPDSADPVPDMAEEVARPWEGRRAVLRLHPALWPPAQGFPSWPAFVAGLDDEPSARSVIEALAEFARTAEAKELEARLGRWTRARGLRLLRPYGEDLAEGLALVAERGLPEAAAPDDEPMTEADEGSFGTIAQPLQKHHEDVAREVAGFSRRLGLAEALTRALVRAAEWHDAGKADPRFQRFLALVAGLAKEPEKPLAKSGRRLPPTEERLARARARLPERFRHEALSVHFAAARFDIDGCEDHDPDLVLWLIGTHHGHGRPFFPHRDPWDGAARELLGVCLPARPGPERLDFGWQGRDWPGLMQALHGRYGIWGLAFLEACLRLADHRASALAERTQSGRA